MQQVRNIIARIEISYRDKQNILHIKIDISQEHKKNVSKQFVTFYTEDKKNVFCLTTDENQEQ